MEITQTIEPLAGKAEKLARSTEIVLAAVRELHDLHQPIKREAVLAVCAGQGLTQMVVDERLRVLVSDGLIYRLKRGEYRPAYIHRAARAISKSVLPDGTVMIELGDDVMHLTPQEDRILAALQAGAAAQLTAIEANYHMSIVSSELARRLTAIERGSASAARNRKPSRARAPLVLD